MNENFKIVENKEFGKVRTLYENGEVLFCGKDVAIALDYSNVNDAIKRFCKGVVKRDLLTEGGRQRTNFIPESDLYRLILRSNLPNAEKFSDWVTKEVLPSIRKTGAYQVPTAPAKNDVSKADNSKVKELMKEVNSYKDSISNVLKIYYIQKREEARKPLGEALIYLSMELLHLSHELQRAEFGTNA